jgi:hypothetical protein
MSEPLAPSVGWGVLHLFCKIGPQRWRGHRGCGQSAGVLRHGDDHQVVTFSVFGHKADLGVMAIGPDWVRLRRLQAALQAPEWRWRRRTCR